MPFKRPNLNGNERKLKKGLEISLVSQKEYSSYMMMLHQKP